MTALRLFVGRLSHSPPTTRLLTTSPLPTPTSIAALCKEGCLNEALHVLHYQNHILHSSAYVHLLQCCMRKKVLHHGKRIHALILNRNHLRFTEDVFLLNTLLQMYVKCGNLVDARDFFDGMMEKDVFSWNVIIAAYRNQGMPEEALALFHQMQRSGSGVQPDEFTFASVLPTCVSSASLEEGVGIHRIIIKSGFHLDVVVTSALIDMYAKFGNIHKARVLFDKMQHRDTISWNVMIAGYGLSGLLKEAENLFWEMQHRNTVSWNALIAGYAQNGLHEEALEVFEEMKRSGVAPNESTFASVLPACISSASLEEGVDIHRKLIRSGFHSNVVVTNVLIDMYAKFGNIEKARVLFDKMQQRDTISWTAMITGSAQNGFHEEALEVYEEMQQSDVVTDVVVTNALIDMYAKIGNIQKARELFDKMKDRTTISWNAMIAGYAQNGFLDEAVKLFRQIPQRDTISWTAMIIGYAQNGYGLEAIKCFQKMQLAGFRPDSITFSSILPVCATFAALKWGMDIHGQTIRCGFALHTMVITALIDMYTKCGNIKKASVLFDKMHDGQTISWNAMIAGYARNGCSKEAIKLFEQMNFLGISSDDGTLVSVLSACSHAGLVKEGYDYFTSMNAYYRITPTMEHYACMVDLLGRAGHLDEAKDFIDSMPVKPDAGVWTCLLGACRIHNNLELAEFVSEQLFELDPQNSAPYVLLSNIYAMHGRWNQIENIRKMMKDRGIRKLPGCSWIVVNKQVHAFSVGSRSHPKTQEI